MEQRQPIFGELAEALRMMHTQLLANAPSWDGAEGSPYAAGVDAAFDAIEGELRDREAELAAAVALLAGMCIPPNRRHALEQARILRRNGHEVTNAVADHIQAAVEHGHGARLSDRAVAHADEVVLPVDPSRVFVSEPVALAARAVDAFAERDRPLEPQPVAPVAPRFDLSECDHLAELHSITSSLHAGVYVDPAGELLLRYWDGADHVADFREVPA